MARTGRSRQRATSCASCAGGKRAYYRNRKLESGDDGAWRNALHSARTAVRGVPGGALVPRTCSGHCVALACAAAKAQSSSPDALGGRFARPARPHAPCAAKKPTQRLVFEPVAIPGDRIRKTATRKAGALSAIGLWHQGGARTFATGATHRHLPQNPAGAVSGARRQVAANWRFNAGDSAHTAPGRDRASAYLQRHKKDRRIRPARARDDNVMLKHTRGCADY